MESPSSVTVSWLPPEAQLWNGIISRYTIVYDLLGRVDKYEDDDILEPYTTQMLSIPQPGLPLTNNPDPRIVMLPLQLETAVVNTLEEFSVYQFAVYLENIVGQSAASNSVTVEMPASGNLCRFSIVQSNLMATECLGYSFYAAPTGAPSNVSAMALSSTSIIVRWQAPEQFDINGILTNFEITVNDTDGTIYVFTLSATAFSFHMESEYISCHYTLWISIFHY